LIGVYNTERLFFGSYELRPTKKKMTT